jgi:hypothetical protein
VKSAYCAVRTESLYKADYVSSLKGLLTGFLNMELESVYCAVRTESLYKTDTLRL